MAFRKAGVSELRDHCDLQHRHHLAALDAEHGCTEDLPARGVDDGLMKPRVSPVSMAFATAVMGNLATRMSRWRSRGCVSVSPTRPSCGSVNIVYGTRLTKSAASELTERL